MSLCRRCTSLGSLCGPFELGLVDGVEWSGDVSWFIVFLICESVELRDSRRVEPVECRHFWPEQRRGSAASSRLRRRLRPPVCTRFEPRQCRRVWSGAGRPWFRCPLSTAAAGCDPTSLLEHVVADTLRPRWPVGSQAGYFVERERTAMSSRRRGLALRPSQRPEPRGGRRARVSDSGAAG